MLLFLGHQYKLELSNKALTATTVQFSIAGTFTLRTESVSRKRCPQRRGFFQCNKSGHFHREFAVYHTKCNQNCLSFLRTMDIKSASKIGLYVFREMRQ